MMAAAMAETNCVDALVFMRYLRMAFAADKPHTERIRIKEVTIG
jgi:hypothetical protein